MVHFFPKGICPKVNIIARLEHGFAYYDSAVHHFNHRDTPERILNGKFEKLFNDLSFSV